jgi:hypothetical protein
MNRRSALNRLGAALTVGFAPGVAAAQETPEPLILRTMRVPFDYERPDDGTFMLQYALLAHFDAQAATVAVISDGQQFFLTASAFRPTIGPLFDGLFNVAGVFGRGQSPAVAQRVRSPQGDVDWPTASRLLGAPQWLGDIEMMRQDLLGSGGRLLLYGRSGGAMMAH